MCEVMADTTRVLVIQMRPGKNQARADDWHSGAMPRIAQRSTQDINRRTLDNVAPLCADSHTQLQHHISFCTGL